MNIGIHVFSNLIMLGSIANYTFPNIISLLLNDLNLMEMSK